MELDFATPDPRLAPYISTYYRVFVDYPLIEDVERADVGYLRFMFSGTGFYDYGGGQRDPDRPVMLLGPATRTASYSVRGPLESFGCVLLPAFWGGIVEAEAHSHANRALDAVPTLGADALILFEALKRTRDVARMGRLMDTFLLPRIRAIPPDHLEVIDRIGNWLSCFPIPPVEELYGSIALSRRQVMRLANRYFGAPPKLLSRKFRALRTASRLIGTRGPVPEALVADYADRAHMIREVKHFTGMTPRNLQINSSPIMQITLHPDNFRSEAPWT